jgi:hypothetical protein
MNTKWIYIKTEPELWTVGFYDPAGGFIPESHWPSALKAAAKVNYLNGGTGKELATLSSPWSVRRALWWQVEEVQ